MHCKVLCIIRSYFQCERPFCSTVCIMTLCIMRISIVPCYYRNAKTSAISQAVSLYQTLYNSLAPPIYHSYWKASTMESPGPQTLNIEPCYNLRLSASFSGNRGMLNLTGSKLQLKLQYSPKVFYTGKLYIFKFTERWIESVKIGIVFSSFSKAHTQICASCLCYPQIKNTDSQEWDQWDGGGIRVP